MNPIDELMAAEKAVAEMFGCDAIHYGVNDCRGDDWCRERGDVTYGTLKAQYEFRIWGTAEWSSKCGEYVMFTGLTDGQRANYVFRRDREVTE